jgi:tetratricopeptide (TPR) repeat protein
LKLLKEYDDQDPNSYYLLGITYNIINQYDKAITELEANLEICRRWGETFMKNNSAYTELGFAYHMTGKYKKERMIYQESEKHIPDDGPTIYRQALLSFAENDSLTADRYVKKFVHTLKYKYSASDWYIAKREAALYADANFNDKTNGLYRKAFSMNPDDPDLLQEFAGFLSKNNGGISEFTDLSDKALSLARNRCDYYNYLDAKGWGLHLLGRNKEALEILKKVLASAPFKLYKYKSHLEQVENTIAEKK